MRSMDAYLSGVFPPAVPIPMLAASDRALLLDLAQGAPGDVVKPGLFPRARTKLARLALAADGHWDPARLVQILDDATDGETPPPYFPHDALLCALVHPSIDKEQRRTVVGWVVHPLGAYKSGARIRRTAWRLARWAVEHGHLDPSDWSDEMEERLLLRHGRRERIAALDAEPTWSSRDVMDAIGLRRGRWIAELPGFHQQGLYYVSIASLGRELCNAVLGGCRKAWVGEVFAAIEQGLERGDSEARNLIVAGLFESMQGYAYRRGPPDLLERCLGPLGARAWCDLIEGWTGGGVRTVERWRRVIRNGALERVRWSRGAEWSEVRFEEGHATWLSPSGESALRGEDAGRLLTHLRPWIATALVKRPRHEPVFTDELWLHGPHDTRTVRVAGDLGTDGKRWFTVDLSAIPWPTRS